MTPEHPMSMFSLEDLRRLIAQSATPSLTIYSPLTPGNKDENQSRFRSLISKAAKLLTVSGCNSSAEELLAPLRRMANDQQPAPTGSGFAYFASPAGETIVVLRAKPVERVTVGTTFVIRPLLTELIVNRYFLLTLSQHSTTLYRGSIDGLTRVEVPGLPLGIEDALRTHDTDEPLTLHSFRRGNGPSEAIFHGHGVGIDDHKDDLLRYFRVIDRALHPILQQETDPLVLAGVRYLFPIYTRANTYRHLMPGGISGNPEHTTLQDLGSAAWSMIASEKNHKIERAVETFRQLRGTNRTVVDVHEAVVAATEGAIGTLLITPAAEARDLPDPMQHRNGTGATTVPIQDELWNLAAVQVLRHRGAVYEVPNGSLGGPDAGAILRMPSD
jgi:hypothetical protein